MKKLSVAAETAKAIRKELKEVFPYTKFSVKSDTWSMGSAINVNWTDGPTRAQVKGIINKYQYGHFNGMIDCYEMTNKRDDIPQVKYVNIPCRRMSSKTEDVIVAWLQVNVPACKGKRRDDFVEELNKDMRELIRDRFEVIEIYL